MSNEKDDELKREMENKVKFLASSGCFNMNLPEGKPILETEIKVLEGMIVEISNLKKNQTDKMSEIESQSTSEKGTSAKLLATEKEKEELEIKLQGFVKQMEELKNNLKQGEITVKKNLEERDKMCKNMENKLAEKDHKIEELSLLVKNNSKNFTELESSTSTWKEKLLMESEQLRTNLENSKLENTRIKDEMNELSRITKDLEVKLAKAQEETETLKEINILNEKTDNKPRDNKAGDANSNTCEEKEFYETQVKFLNSIIFDQQNKIDLLNSRIQELEAYRVEENQNGEERRVKRKAVERAPRLFCDICDEFDLHDTEDCPEQASIDPPPRSLNPRKPKVKLPPRSYCDVCEMFDHETGECQDNDTY